jgi:flagellar protein FlgJ
MMQATQPDLYMNMQQFSELKLEAREHSAGASKKAAQQFEGLFIQMMLKNMRAAAVMDESQHSSYMDFYSEMYDKQMALMMSQQGGIGIADLLHKQLDQNMPEGQNAAAPGGHALPVYRLPVTAEPVLPLPLAEMNYVASNPQVSVHSVSEHLPESVPLHEIADRSLQSETIEPFYGWQQPDTFVRDLWPHAQQAAEQLGVSAQVLVAQSALETGWGKFAMKKEDGSIAFNLFGIKAGSDWAGQSVSHQTLEFRDGAMQREAASFRAYDSVSDAIDDYVSFVKQRPRYADALDHGGSDLDYIGGLHEAGYATDPEYTRKIQRILQSETLQQALLQVAQGDRPAVHSTLTLETAHG